jgi:hypothetical protein
MWYTVLMSEFRDFTVIASLRMTLCVVLCAAPAVAQFGSIDHARLAAVENLQRQIGAADAVVRQAAAEVPRITDAQNQPIVHPEVKTTAVPVATKDQRDQLISLITTFEGRAATNQTRYSAAATSLLFAGCALALIASILSFLRMNTVAGILGLAVAALTALPTAYPVNGLASFYRTLSAQSTALLYDCSLRDPLTMDAFNSASDQLQLLVVYEGEKFPQLGSTQDVSGELVKELQALKVVNQPANLTVEKR